MNKLAVDFDVTDTTNNLIDRVIYIYENDYLPTEQVDVLIYDEENAIREMLATKPYLEDSHIIVLLNDPSYWVRCFLISNININLTKFDYIIDEYIGERLKKCYQLRQYFNIEHNDKSSLPDFKGFERKTTQVNKFTKPNPDFNNQLFHLSIHVEDIDDCCVLKKLNIHNGDTLPNIQTLIEDTGIHLCQESQAMIHREFNLRI